MKQKNEKGKLESKHRTLAIPTALAVDNGEKSHEEFAIAKSGIPLNVCAIAVKRQMILRY